MASSNYSLKIHEHCRVAPPPASASHSSSLSLTLFDLLWLRFHPVECIIFYSFPIPHTDPSYFFDKVVPKLKSSLSLTLQHFLPLAGNIVWPSDSSTPIIQYTPGDEQGGVSLVIAESDTDFNHILDNSSPHEPSESRSFVPHLESSDSLASLISLQVTLIQNSGFCIGISTHHAFLDGKSAITFIKAWASISQVGEDEKLQSLVPELEPSFHREVIKDVTGLDLFFKHNNNSRSLKILPFEPKVENTVRATFELTRTDLDNIKKRVLSKWDTVAADGEAEFLSSFVVTCAYVSVCIAKAIQGVDKERQKFAFSFIEDCRARLQPPIPENYFGNCVWGHFVDTNPMDYTKKDGVVIVAKNIYNKIKMLDKGFLELDNDVISELRALSSEGVDIIAVAGSNRFGMYGIDFGWGRPTKVEITSVDRGLAFAILDSKDQKGGIQVGLVLNKHVMDLFETFFHESIDGI